MDWEVGQSYGTPSEFVIFHETRIRGWGLIEHLYLYTPSNYPIHNRINYVFSSSPSAPGGRILHTYALRVSQRVYYE